MSVQDRGGQRRDGKRSARLAQKPKPPADSLASRARGRGDEVHDPASDWRFDLDQGPVTADPAVGELMSLIERELELLGEDPARPGLQKTPLRVASALRWLTRGYGMDVEAVVGDAVFVETHESMIMVRDIELYSLCEHHLLPFFGKCHIAYIPAGQIVGLSKLPRLVEVFARRLQVQERLTEQIAEAVETVLAPRGVGVVIEAAHLCMMMRGVEKQNSKAITSAVRGVFRDDAKTRDEFLRLAHGATSVLT